MAYALMNIGSTRVDAMNNRKPETIGGGETKSFSGWFTLP